MRETLRHQIGPCGFQKGGNTGVLLVSIVIKMSEIDIADGNFSVIVSAFRENPNRRTVVLVRLFPFSKLGVCRRRIVTKRRQKIAVRTPLLFKPLPCSPILPHRLGGLSKGFHGCGSIDINGPSGNRVRKSVLFHNGECLRDGGKSARPFFRPAEIADLFT